MEAAERAAAGYRHRGRLRQDHLGELVRRLARAAGSVHGLSSRLTSYVIQRSPLPWTRAPLCATTQFQILRAAANAGHWDAAGRLADLLARHGNLNDALQILRARADEGDWPAARRLADLLAERGDLDELCACVGAGDAPSSWSAC